MEKGFTLIELLVVVLIIGILSAVALPQYTKAVEKARMAEAMSAIGALKSAVDAHVLSYGYEDVDNLVDLDVTIPEESKNFMFRVYCYDHVGCGIQANRREEGAMGSYGGYSLVALKEKDTGKWRHLCEYSSFAYLNGPKGEKACKSLGDTWISQEE